MSIPCFRLWVRAQGPLLRHLCSQHICWSTLFPNLSRHCCLTIQVLRVAHQTRLQQRSDMAATPTEQQALAEEHNTTNCPLLCLPAELRIQIEEYATSCSNDPKSWASLQTDLHPNTTHAGYLQTCRLLRTEMLPLYLNTPELYFQCYPQPIGATALFTRHVPIIKRWVELVIAERDVSRDKLGVSVMLGRSVDKAQQDVEVSFSA